MSGESEPEDKVEFSKDMAETMRHWGGIGLSANQVGFPYRMFVMGDNDNYINCWNPRILVESDNKVAIQEGCLTYPGLFVKIFRPDWIEDCLIPFFFPEFLPLHVLFKSLIKLLFKI